MAVTTRSLRLAAVALAIASLPMVSAQSSSNVQGASTSTVISSLVLNLVIFAIEVSAFLILRPRFPKVYRPKTYLGLHEERVAALPDSLLGWIPAFIKVPTTEILYKNGLDAYQFMAFLEMMVWFFAPTFVFTWLLLLPIYGAGTSVGQTGFNQFVFGNVGTPATEQLRYIAPLFANWIVVIWFIYVMRRFLTAFVKHRQEFLSSPQHAASAQARTILITGIPNDYLSEKKLTAMYSHMPGGVAKVWLNRDLKDMPDLFDQRMQACNKLEAAQSKLQKIAFKKVKKGKVEGATFDKDAELSLDVADKYVTKKERPTHKLGLMGCFGQKVDTIQWCQEEIPRLTKELDEKRRIAETDYDTYKPQAAAFLLFHNQIAAQIAAKAQAHHLPYRMANHYTGAHPLDVIWPNLNMNPYAVKIRTLIGWAITIAIVIFWTVITGVVGVISNVSGLATEVSWLSWLNSIPSVVVGIIQGILPVVLLAVLNILLVMFLRFLGRWSGIPTRTGVELSLFTRMAIFSLVQNFLILTIISGASSGINEIVPIISDPAGLPDLLAQVVPSASIFFLSFVLLQGIAGSAAGLLQVAPLAIYYIKKFLLASTPRKTWHIDNDMSSVAWGTLFASTTLITVIGIGYSILAPIMNLFALVAFTLFFIMYKYNFTYVYNMSGASETAGLFFPKAINFVFAAMYLEMVIITVLFFLASNAKPEGAFMIVLIVLTVGAHFFIYDSYGSLFNSLPLSLVPAAGTDNAASHGNGVNGTTDEKKQLLAGAQQPNSGLHQNSASVASQDQTAGGDSSQSHAGEEDPMLAFTPIPLKENQREIWLAEDTWGIAQSQSAKNKQAGISTTTIGAKVNEKGKIDTDAFCPPGEFLH